MNEKSFWRVWRFLVFWFWPIFRVFDMVVAHWTLLGAYSDDRNLLPAVSLIRKAARNALVMIVASFIAGLVVPFIFLGPLVDITGWRTGAFILFVILLGYATDTEIYNSNFVMSSTYSKSVSGYSFQSLLPGIFWGIILVSKYVM